MPKTMTRLSIALLALSALTASAAAEDRLKLKSGEVLVGEATAYDDAAKIATFVTTDGTERKVHIDRFLLLSDLCCYTQGDNNCGVNMNQYFGKGGDKATIQSMLDRYRQQVNPNLQVYSINLNGHAQSQLRAKGNNHLLSGWSEQIFNVIRDIEELATHTPAEPVEIPALEALRLRYRKQARQWRQT